MLKKIRIVEHYGTDDPECISDHYGIDIYFDDELVWELEDEYHDSSLSQIKGFFKALELFGISVDLVYERKADFKTYEGDE